jgi:hypothetical protein
MSVIARSPLELRGNPENNKRRTGLPHAARRIRSDGMDTNDKQDKLINSFMKQKLQ